MIASLTFDRPLIMGIVNVTPDSFSGDGVMQQADYVTAAVQQALQMVADGAQILDIGGESSRPGAMPVESDEEIRRVVPVIQALRQAKISTPIAVDTVKASVAEAALKAGADIINDISALAHDEAMARVVAQYKAWIVLMHNRSETRAVTHDPRLGGEYQAPIYENVTTDVMKDLNQCRDVALKAGIDATRIILDPGIGFGKTVEQNLMLINSLDRLQELGCPVLLGASRKGFIGRVLNTKPEERLEGTAAIVAAGVIRGANILRVHDVKFMARVVTMIDALLTAGIRNGDKK